MRHYINSALLYAILAMAGGVFYRESTKFSGFTAKPPSLWYIPIIFCWAWCFFC